MTCSAIDIAIVILVVLFFVWQAVAYHARRRGTPPLRRRPLTEFEIEDIRRRLRYQDAPWRDSKNGDRPCR